MEPDLIAAIIAAAIPELAKDSIKEVYSLLKETIKKKFGQNNNLPEAIEDLEKEPYSIEKRSIVKSKIADARVDQDHEILSIVEKLDILLNSYHGAERQIGVQISGGKVQGIIGADQVQVNTIKFEDLTS